MENTKILNLANQVCEILDTDYDEMISSVKRKSVLARAMCVYFCTTELNEPSTTLAKFFNVTRRQIHRYRATIRDGIVREKYYSEPYNKIKEGLSS